VEAQVQSKTSPCEACSGQSGTGTGFSGRTGFSPVALIPPMLHTHIYLYVALTRTNGRSWKPSKISALSEIGENRIRKYCQEFRL